MQLIISAKNCFSTNIQQLTVFVVGIVAMVIAS